MCLEQVRLLAGMVDATEIRPPPGSNGGTATASIDLTSQGGVSAAVIVNGGNGSDSEFGQGGKGADVSLDSNSINATSTSGDFVILGAEARGGRGGATDTVCWGRWRRYCFRKQIGECIIAHHPDIRPLVAPVGQSTLTETWASRVRETAERRMRRRAPRTIAVQSSQRRARSLAQVGTRFRAGWVAAAERQCLTPKAPRPVISQWQFQYRSRGEAGNGSPNHGLRTFDGGNGETLLPWPAAATMVLVRSR